MLAHHFLALDMEQNRVERCRFDLGDSAVSGLALTQRAPNTYTGQDVIELILPGNRTLLERVLARLIDSAKVRLAGPGEFTARAYLNGRMSLDQAEGVALTIAARSAHELSAAKQVLRGDFGARCQLIADQLTTLLSLVEAGIDFADEEDVVPVSSDEAQRQIASITDALDRLLGSAPARARTIVPRVVLVGPPNAGKSTLFNALLGRTRSVVSEVGGTTRDAIEETLDLSVAAPGGGSVELVDLAGLDRAMGDLAGVDTAAQSAAKDQIHRADVVVLCDPAGRFETSTDAIDVVTLRVRTKADCLVDHLVNEAIGVCALDGWNLAALKRAIADAAAGVGAGETLMAPRHDMALRLAQQSLTAAMDRTSVGDRHSLVDAELIALDLRRALDAVGSITGNVTPDDVIGRIFSTFCVGK